MAASTEQQQGWVKLEAQKEVLTEALDDVGSVESLGNYISTMRVLFVSAQLDEEKCNALSEEVPANMSKQETAQMKEEIALDLGEYFASLEEEQAKMMTDCVECDCTKVLLAEARQQLCAEAVQTVQDEIKELEAAKPSETDEEPEAVQKRKELQSKEKMLEDLQEVKKVKDRMFTKAKRIAEKSELPSASPRKRSFTSPLMRSKEPEDLMSSPLAPFSLGAESQIELGSDGADLSFGMAIKTMADEVQMVFKVGIPPGQVTERVSLRTSKAFELFKVEIMQPGEVNMNLVAWGALATRAVQDFKEYRNKVVRVGLLKYSFYQRDGEHQMLLQKGYRIEEVTEACILDKFRSVAVAETPISHFPRMKGNFERVHFKGFLRAYDLEASGPATNGRYWRNFEVSDTSGLVVKCKVWGDDAADGSWKKHVSVEIFNALLKKEDQLVVLNEESCILFHETYTLSLTPPRFFKYLEWSLPVSSKEPFKT